MPVLALQLLVVRLSPSSGSPRHYVCPPSPPAARRPSIHPSSSTPVDPVIASSSVPRSVVARKHPSPPPNPPSGEDPLDDDRSLPHLRLRCTKLTRLVPSPSLGGGPSNKDPLGGATKTWCDKPRQRPWSFARYHHLPKTHSAESGLLKNSCDCPVTRPAMRLHCIVQCRKPRVVTSRRIIVCVGQHGQGQEDRLSPHRSGPLFGATDEV